MASLQNLCPLEVDRKVQGPLCLCLSRRCDGMNFTMYSDGDRQLIVPLWLEGGVAETLLSLELGVHRILITYYWTVLLQFRTCCASMFPLGLKKYPK